MSKKDANTLWVALSKYGEGNLFHVYPQLLSELVLLDEAARGAGAGGEHLERLVLPSDREWRLQNYFMLVAMQKRDLADADDGEEQNEADKSTEEVEVWAPWSLGLAATRNPNVPAPVAVRRVPGPSWDIAQVVKAARLLLKTPVKVEFVDEHEMRCVYSLIYDVFRYKSILEQAIDDVEFFEDYPLLLEYRHAVWLFLMELAKRGWCARPRGDQDSTAALLHAAGAPFPAVERAVWDQRVHFAAAIARIRIKNKAFTLSELLPPHVREEKISACVHKETVTGWVNTFKAKKVAALVKRLHELGYSYSSSRQLWAGEYRFDRVCPRFITLRPPANVSIGQLDLVRDGIIVLQEREFCEGASTLCRALRANALQGVVAQTHASSPRCSAYLAAQLRELAAVLRAQTPAAPAAPALGKLVVFGAGDQVESYVSALRELGIEASGAPQSDAPVCVLGDPVHGDTPRVHSALEGVVAALATPPNSYSSVTDPIDLVCGRGGDLAMLEILTQSEVDNEGKARVQSILEEQKKTLKTLLSKPQIQLILYETHSALEAENQAQITRAVAEANRLAREKHQVLKKKPKDQQSFPQKSKDAVASDSATSIDNTISRSDIGKDEQLEDIFEDEPRESADQSATARSRPASSNILKKKADSESLDRGSRPGTTKARPIPEVVAPASHPLPRDPDKDSPDVHVPDCDLFEIRTLPHLGNGLDINYILDRDGCYLGLIQRKEITRLDAKYMIQVAEERGLFGPAAPAPARRKRDAAAAPRRRKRNTSGFEVERVSAPTYASMVRSTRRGSAPASLSVVMNAPEVQVCERHARRQAAASALAAAACTCDARHRAAAARRRTSLEGSEPAPARGGGPCRRPFPLVVHDLRLRSILPLQHRKIFA